VPGTGGQYIAGSTGPGGVQLIYGTTTPIYLVDVPGLPSDASVNLGYLTVSGGYESNQYGYAYYYFPTYSSGGYQPIITPIEYCSPGPGSCPAPPTITPAVIPLVFQEGSSFQLSFVNGVFTPPVPEPSTWAMLLIGFVGIGFAAYRRSHKTVCLQLRVI
jgi:PEP-CTERM motif